MEVDSFVETETGSGKLEAGSHPRMKDAKRKKDKKVKSRSLNINLPIMTFDLRL